MLRFFIHFSRNLRQHHWVYSGISPSRQITVLEISVEIAALATSDMQFSHFDPADRIIAATAIYHQADLITCDQHLKNNPKLSIIW